MKLTLDYIFKPCSVHFSSFYILWSRVKIEKSKSRDVRKTGQNGCVRKGWELKITKERERKDQKNTEVKKN